MKANTLLFMLLYSATTALAQDFQAVPPSEQPYTAQLAYLSGRYPEYLEANAARSADVRTVIRFLNNLKDGQLEAAHQQLAEGYMAVGPGYADARDASSLLQLWDHNGQTYLNQQVEIERAIPSVVTSGERQGDWVFVKAIWSGQVARPQGVRIKVPFFSLFRLKNGQIVHSYTSYGSDRIFYDLGFPLYTQSAEVTQNR